MENAVPCSNRSWPGMQITAAQQQAPLLRPPGPLACMLSMYNLTSRHMDLHTEGLLAARTWVAMAALFALPHVSSRATHQQRCAAQLLRAVMLPEGPAILHECLVTSPDMADCEEEVVHDSSMIYLQQNWCNPVLPQVSRQTYRMVHLQIGRQTRNASTKALIWQVKGCSMTP